MKPSVLFLVLSFVLAACNNETPVPETAKPTPAASNASVATSATVAASSVSVTNPDHNPNWQTYTVGSQLTYPPFHYQGEKGEPLGFEMELLQLVAKAGEFNVNVQHAPRSSLETTLDNGSIQIWSSTISVTPERSEKMDFSQPFMQTDREVILIQDNEANQKITDLNHLRGKKLAINKYSSTAPEITKKLTGAASNAVITDSYHLSMKELFAGNVDGVLDNELVLINYLRNNANAPKTRSLLVAEEKKDFAFAVKKGNTELLNKINKGLEKVKADGSYQKLVEKWFGDKLI